MTFQRFGESKALGGFYETTAQMQYPRLPRQSLFLILAALGVDLDTHIQPVLDAMNADAETLGLVGSGTD